MQTTLNRIGWLCLILATVACGGDDGTGPVEEDSPIELSVSLESASGAPLERIRVTGIPADVDDVYAKVLVTGPTERSLQQSEARALIDRTESGDYLLAPLHPTDPLSGGSVRIVVTDGKNITSNEVPLSVSTLPPAPGTFGNVIDLVQLSLDGWLRVHGTTRETLRNTPVTTLPTQHLPLLIAHTLIDSPDNPNSLRALADGDIPLFAIDAAARDILDRVTAAAGAVAYLETSADFADTLTVFPDPTAFAAGLKSDARSVSACITAPNAGITDCFTLSSAMNWQYQVARTLGSATRTVENGVIFAGTTVLAFTQARGIGAGLGAVTWAMQKLEESQMNLLPSSFNQGATEFNPDPVRFKEDDPGPGNPREFMVQAVSRGWSVDQLILEGLMQGGGLLGGGTRSLFQNTNQFKDDLSGMIVGEAMNGIIGGATNGSNIVQICANAWRVDCTGELFLKATVVTGDAITVGSGITYVPRKFGESDLRLETKDAFGEAHTGTTRNIIVERIVVSVSPDVSSAEPGDPVDFTVTVGNALSAAVKWTTTMGSIFATSENTARLITPNDPWDEPIKVTARSTANTGARKGKVDSDPRDGIAFVNVKRVTVTVSPSDICLKPGEQQTFSAAVTGTVNHAVTWSIQPPGAGTIVGSTYTAPGTFQDVTVIAESVDDPTAKGSASVEVSNCGCEWEATFAGGVGGSASGTYAVRVEPQGMIFEPTEGGGPPTITVITGPVTGTGVFDVGVTFITTSQQLWSNMDPGVPMPMLTVNVYDPGVEMRGTISGELHQIESIGPPITYRSTSMFLTFRAAFFDPKNPSSVCE